MSTTSIFDILPPPEPGETPWFKGGEAPARPGVYKRMLYKGEGWEGPGFCRWEGAAWLGGYRTIEALEAAEAAGAAPRQSAYQPFMRDGFDFAWCGLLPPVAPPSDDDAGYSHSDPIEADPAADFPVLDTKIVEPEKDMSFFDEN